MIAAAVRDASVDTDVAADKFGSQILYFKRPAGYAD
jgi:hypothetical protein